MPGAQYPNIFGNSLLVELVLPQAAQTAKLPFFAGKSLVLHLQEEPD